MAARTNVLQIQCTTIMLNAKYVKQVSPKFSQVVRSDPGVSVPPQLGMHEKVFFRTNFTERRPLRAPIETDARYIDASWLRDPGRGGVDLDAR